MDNLPSLNECPKSFLLRTPEGQLARWLVDTLRDNDYIREYTHAQLFGTDSSQWPEWYWDATLQLAMEKKKVEIGQINHRIRMAEQEARSRG